MNPLKELNRYGQAVWLDYIRRSLITGGELKRMVEEDGITGVTINPTIFEKAIAGSEDYDEAVKELLEEDPHLNARGLYEKLAVQDVQMTADILRPVFERTDGADGYVSLELSPDLAHDTEGSIKEARYFRDLVGRPNLLIKVPATPAGIPVIEALIAEGINVNVTLMFSLSHYEAVANAYIRGLKRASDPSKISSVASFFVSRVDTLVDSVLEENGSPDALKLRGRIAVANSKLAYRRFTEVFRGEDWERLAAREARVQRVLWASTGTKNPAYSDVLYVEDLIGRDTVNTMPPAIMNAFYDHGKVHPTLEQGIDKAEQEIKRLGALGIDLDALTEKLQVEGVEKFSDSYDKLLTALDEKKSAIRHGQMERQRLSLGKLQEQIDRRLEEWRKIDFNRRLWEKDPTLWFSRSMPEITDRLGWLTLPETMHEQLESIVSFAREVKNDGIHHVVLLGMGGSSLAPYMFQETFGNAPGYPELIVLDSTHPDAIRRVDQEIDARHTLFIVSSKSGTTLEPNAFFKHFWDRVSRDVKDPGRHFAAITDPGTPLEKLAKIRGFRRVFLAPPDLGGRYSALTVFGLVPAALIGMEVHKLVDRAWVAAEGCAFCVPEQKTPGLALGAALGELASHGRDKVTFLISPAIKGFQDWLEQLIAESTGKDGRGIVPIAGEPLSDPLIYGGDRLFVHFSLDSEDGAKWEKGLEALTAQGHPIVRINLADRYDLGLEIFRWEVAVASAGAVLGIHPFNQPDVELAKDLARQAMKGGSEEADEIDTLQIHDHDELTSSLRGFFSGSGQGDYFAVHAYLQPTDETTGLLQKIRLAVLERYHLATTVGYGPRFLHSTGQLHKGGPNTGLFLQLVDEPANDLPVPETNYTFGDIIKAQALGDYQALKQRGRRVLRIDLKKDSKGGLALIERIITEI